MFHMGSESYDLSSIMVLSYVIRTIKYITLEGSPSLCLGAVSRLCARLNPAMRFQRLFHTIKNPHHFVVRVILLVEAAGIEPASASPLPAALHA